MEHNLEIQNLCKSYRDFTLDNLSFCLPKGSIMGLIGENGAGKTTTLKLILDVICRDSGEIRIFGMDNRQQQKQIKQNIGVAFEDNFFYHLFTPADIEKVLSAAYQNWDHALYQRYLEQFRLPRGKILREFSRGMRMKLSLAAALAHHPRLLLLDEATSGLDPIVRGEVLDVFLEFIQQEENSILFSSHITSDLEKIADYITFIHRGGLVFSESKESLLERHAIVRCSSERALGLLGKDFVVHSHKNRFGCEILVNDRERVRGEKDLIVDKATLEDIMSYYVGSEK